jgi:hypothetical protein
VRASRLASSRLPCWFVQNPSSSMSKLRRRLIVCPYKLQHPH